MVENDRFLDREIGWLEFNKRILSEASNQALPLLERVKFLSIASVNLNEFIAIRCAKIRKNNKLLYLEILSNINLIIEKKIAITEAIKSALHNNSIRLVSRLDWTLEEKLWSVQYFLKNLQKDIVVKRLTKENLEQNLTLAPILIVQYLSYKEIHHHIIISKSPYSHFINIERSKEVKFATIEDIIIENLPSLFNQADITQTNVIFPIRDSIINFHELFIDSPASYYPYLKQREKAKIICIMADDKKSELIDSLSTILELKQEEIFECKDFISLASINQLYQIDKPELKFKSYISRKYDNIKDIFLYLIKQDLILHHPYDSFDFVTRFIIDASEDPEVITINQTVYRTNYNSKIMAALINAAKNGKKVNIIMELKSRFSEWVNLYWIEKLQNNNINVILTDQYIKAHLKVTLIEKRVNQKTVGFVHFSTGNYNAHTAQFYSDLSYFTSNEKIVKDIRKIFQWFQYKIKPQYLNQITIAPWSLRHKIIKLIQREMTLAKQGEKASIIMKLNALTDKTVIHWLYLASNAGVKIQLIIRGICCLRPGIKNLSTNITVKSIVGRFLEHSRILFFSGGEDINSDQSKIFISSADLMERNFDERVEAMLLIRNKNVKKTIYQILECNLKDKKQSWELYNDKYIKIGMKDDFSMQEFFMDTSQN